MKRTVAIVAGLALAALVLISLQRRSANDGYGDNAAAESAERRGVREFWAAYNRASTLRTEGRFAEAAALYRKCAELNPRHEDSLYYLGTSLQELGRYAEAAEVLRKLIALNPSSSRAQSQLGNALATLAPGAVPDFDTARQAYLKSIEINREEAGPFMRLGLLELNYGKTPEALEHFRTAAGFGSPEGLFWAGYTCYLLQRDDEATRFFTKALEQYSRERKVAARGVFSEGDVLPKPGKPLTALDRVGLKSLLFLYWTARRQGGYPAQVTKEMRIQPAALHSPPESPAKKPLLHIVSTPAVSAIGRGAWGDFDGDGDPDLVVAGRSIRLYRNGDGRLVDSTAATGLVGLRDGWDAVWVDFDGNGSLDLYVIRSGYVGEGQNQLWANDGHGRFTDVTEKVGLAGKRSTVRACFADIDGDGTMDLVEVGAPRGGEGSVRLYRNSGSRFVKEAIPAFAERGTAVDCVVGDFNKDGQPDLFILYWRAPAVLYANRGGGRFEDVTAASGLAGVGGSSFSATSFDFDKDGRLDLLVSAQAPAEEVVRSTLQPDAGVSHYSPRLFRNLGGHFEEITDKAGLHRAYGTMQAVAGDFDGDGWTDILLANGGLEAARLEPSVVLRNVEGKRLDEWSYLPAFDRPENFLGASLARDKRNGKTLCFFAVNPNLSRLLPALAGEE
ncbi:MAG: FG-GAP-like repeat-containing protein [Terriglobia bacterium]